MSKIISVAILGLDAVPIVVESDISNGLPSFSIVGLPDAAVQESKERIRSAIKNSGLSFPRTRVTINLAPADVKKEGSLYDLPIALSILISNGLVFENNSFLEDSLFLGELGLSGTLRPVTGVLSAALMARENNFKNIFLPEENAIEASLIKGINIYPVKNLFLLLEFLNNKIQIEKFVSKEEIKIPTNYDLDFSHIRGQEHAKRALQIAASGGHNILFVGPPGSGKTMLARALPSILPPLTEEESIEVTRIWSVANLLDSKTPLVNVRPYRNPHHTASAVSLVGGGTNPKPGEVSLAHRGVLFLDELPEFGRHVLENLRQPLEDGFVTVSRASGTSRFPAKFMLVAAANPCPCGFSTDPNRQCICSPSQILNYKKRISGPLMDRIDMYIDVPALKVDELMNQEVSQTSTEIRNSVTVAREKQIQRNKIFGVTNNALLKTEDVKKCCALDSQASELLRNATDKMRLSARSYYRVLKLARTVADMADSENVEAVHIGEALQYRQKDDSFLVI